MESLSTRHQNHGKISILGEHAASGDYVSNIWHEAAFGLEWLRLRWSAVYAGAGVKRGDGAPVIVVPGLFATDACTVELRAWLDRVGYRSSASGIGLNVECPQVLVDRLTATIDAAYAECGRRVTLVGHSLGGLLARGAAMQRPQMVSHVITLGSPVRGIRVHHAIAAAARSANRDCDTRCLLQLQCDLPPGVQETNIYSPSDAIVDPATCTRAGASTVAVTGTHTGLIVNAEVYERLAVVLAASDVCRPRRRACATRQRHERSLAKAAA
jgi:pimeloyl-ACP methyl ester carboxylesterase